ncbi:MAG: hypothetical protein U9R50_06335 [Campylobacterota bacterium]|nr:hypothetical protein [Campylobacterota bacterium]
MINIKALIIVQIAIFSLWLYSFEFFINFEVAWLSAFLIMLGSMYSYQNLVAKRVEAYESNDDLDAIDKIDDPYDLYSEVPAIEDEERDISDIVKEEKARLKANKINGIKAGAPATVSFFRLLPYLFLVMGFIGLNNNELLLLLPYLLGLGVGIISAFFMGKIFFTSDLQ